MVVRFVSVMVRSALRVVLFIHHLQSCHILLRFTWEMFAFISGVPSHGSQESLSFMKCLSSIKSMVCCIILCVALKQKHEVAPEPALPNIVYKSSSFLNTVLNFKIQ